MDSCPRPTTCPAMLEKQAASDAVDQNAEGVAEGGVQETLLVEWQGEHDPECPLNWPAARKWLITIISSLGGFVCLVSSTMLAPALGNIADDLAITRETANMTLSIFVLACAFGPLVLAPMAEVFGRRRIWLVCSLWYVVWNMVCGFARDDGLLLSARLFAGLGSSAEYAVSVHVASFTLLRF